ncbi:MAG: aminotransferase class I/II-fold pyridoxal phosphate-dependent enzyme [Candidatus Latescibacterota bacterium]|nr:MAG: aminotransferase class I/II-fold pyridoxal phosphate-dependent enzyme [Candidatus Latescibacterota bacterium]
MKASRLLTLPPYLFEDLENRFRTARGEGRDVIDLSIGDPDLSPPKSLISHLETALRKDRHHRYPPQRGTAALKDAVGRYLGRRAGLSPSEDEILILVGSKEGIAHLPLAICNEGDLALIPDPGYPVYHSSARFAGCAIGSFPLTERNGYRPDFADISKRDLTAARLLFLNYPNNPTSAAASETVFHEALQFGEKHGVVVVNDAAYADVYFEGGPAPLLSAQRGALEMPMIEFFSFSKTFCVTGWRVGFAVGNRDVIEALAHLKANIDSGVFGAIQEAVARTLDTDGDEFTVTMRETFKERRDSAVRALDRLGFHCFPACATFYVWAKVPRPFNAMDFALHLLEKADVLVTPGTGFGKGGEGYFRIALTQPKRRIEEALDRLGRL